MSGVSKNVKILLDPSCKVCQFFYVSMYWRGIDGRFYFVDSYKVI